MALSHHDITILSKISQYGNIAFMDGFQRTQVNTLVKRLAEESHHLITLSGPRQSGKTTIALQALQQTGRKSRYVAVDRPSSAIPPITPDTSGAELEEPRPLDLRGLVENWEQARQEARTSKQGFVLVLDEIQKIPQWSEAVKGLWDADRIENCPLHVIILGSSPLLMQSGLTETLAGRFESIDVEHWSFEEMSRAFGFDLNQYVYFGGYPGAARFCREQERWREYVLKTIIATNIDRDIFAMNRVDKPALLKQLFELGTGYSGRIISYNKLLGQLQDAGNTTTLARYLDLLTQTRLLVGLPKYSGSFHRTRASSPKLNVLNTALMTANSLYSFEEAQADRTFWGHLVESTVGAHLFNTMSSDMRLHYWRDGPHEVDFVLERDSRIIAIEVGSGQNKKSLVGLNEFQQKFKPYITMLVGMEGIPLNEFLTTPATQWFESV